MVFNSLIYFKHFFALVICCKVCIKTVLVNKGGDSVLNLIVVC